MPLGQLGVPPLARGSAASIAVGDEAVVIGHGGRAHALKAQVFAKREFAGFWEYVLDEAIYTTPPHPEWSGAALVGMDGRLLGIGSLFVQEAVDDKAVKGNLFVPVDLLEPILDDLLTRGRLVVAAATVAGDVHRRGQRPPRGRRHCDRRTRRPGRRATRRRGRRGGRQARRRSGRTLSQRVAAGSRGDGHYAGTVARRRVRRAWRCARATATTSCANRAFSEVSRAPSRQHGS